VSDLVTVELKGGRVSGALVELPADRVGALNLGELTVSAAGKLYDRSTGAYVPRSRVVRRPHKRAA